MPVLKSQDLQLPQAWVANALVWPVPVAGRRSSIHARGQRTGQDVQSRRSHFAVFDFTSETLG
ncbi:hypothetical protein TB9_02030 [Xanthomonas perforans]|uniref:Uncharacterized protein n=1 Tax=Xanthomonas perforans TaxID=442694 RepID=A0ABR5ETV8_XANPE|nr:hypothetical protein BJD13_10200 [Xanthomonas perforans]KLC06910.1 hypothetical protein XP420_08555 [Xanthomonas perforans]KLC07412.1 hypothetical protein XP315_06090 [Xanthomonas perforans]KLC11964.1 hypothetical protein XP4B_08845 [Xanthomonas perforans]KLC16572.1 hypothetical protein XP56_13795 [Xanthomonas perforans]